MFLKMIVQPLQRQRPYKGQGSLCGSWAPNWSSNSDQPRKEISENVSDVHLHILKSRHAPRSPIGSLNVDSVGTEGTSSSWSCQGGCHLGHTRLPSPAICHRPALASGGDSLPISIKLQCLCPLQEVGSVQGGAFRKYRQDSCTGTSGQSFHTCRLSRNGNDVNPMTSPNNDVQGLTPTSLVSPKPLVHISLLLQSREFLIWFGNWRNLVL